MGSPRLGAVKFLQWKCGYYCQLHMVHYTNRYCTYSNDYSVVDLNKLALEVDVAVTVQLYTLFSFGPHGLLCLSV